MDCIPVVWGARNLKNAIFSDFAIENGDIIDAADYGTVGELVGKMNELIDYHQRYLHEKDREAQYAIENWKLSR